MMLPEKRVNQIAIRQDFYLEEKRAKLQNEVVISKMREGDLIIANAGVQKPIRAYEDDELMTIVAKSVKMICRDIGIAHWDNSEKMKYDAIRFYTTLKRYYKDLSLQEVKMAFELAAVGELDEWLPKNRSGDPDNNHYQSFSMDYYTKILKAYRNKKSGVWSKVNKALPVAPIVISPEERAEIRSKFLQEIFDAFKVYKESGVEPNFIISIFFKEFYDRGLIEEGKPSSKSIDRAYRMYALSDTPRKEKKAVLAAFHKNNIAPVLMNNAQRIEGNKKVAEYFDKIIEEGKDLEEIFKTVDKK